MTVCQSRFIGGTDGCGDWPATETDTVASSVVAMAASRNEPFGISDDRICDDRIFANAVIEVGPTMLAEVHCIIRIVLSLLLMSDHYLVLCPKSSCHMFQAPVLDISVRPGRASRPSDCDVDFRSRPRVLVGCKLRRRRRVHVQEGGLTPFFGVRFRNLGRVVGSIAVGR
jgi:hypothetical protein